MPYTLIVIDMQRDFHAANNRRCISNVKHEIYHAMAAHSDIIFVEFGGFKRTLKSFYDIVDDYKKFHLVRKFDQDGSRVVFNYLSAMNLNTKHIKFCGVNTSQCVKDTVVGLKKKFTSSKFEVVSGACADEGGTHEHKEALKTFEFYGIKVV